MVDHAVIYCVKCNDNLMGKRDVNTLVYTCSRCGGFDTRPPRPVKRHVNRKRVKRKHLPS